MKKVTVKIPAKVNLTLDVLGVTGKYHDIKSLVASINLFDAITLYKRSDHQVTVRVTGIPLDCDPADNNAYKAAKLFCKKFSLEGVDIRIKKNIPVGGGLGGSSADIAGVLIALKQLYGIDCDLLPIANELGSDAGYMLYGGYAEMSGRGDKIERYDSRHTFYLLLITEDGQISAKTAYKKFDDAGVYYEPATPTAKSALFSGGNEKLFACLKNDLQKVAEELFPGTAFNITALKKAGGKVALLAGSGPTTYAIFDNKKERDKVYKKLLPLYGKKLIRAETVLPLNYKTQNVKLTVKRK